MPVDDLLLSAPLGLLIGAFPVVNEFPDDRSDVAPNGPLGTLVSAPPVRGPVRRRVLLPAWLGGIAILPAVIAARAVLRHPESTPRIVLGQARTMAAFVAYAAGAGSGMLFVR